MFRFMLALGLLGAIVPQIHSDTDLGIMEEPITDVSAEQLETDEGHQRMEGLINQSEDFSQIQLEIERFWFVDQPSHLTYERIQGGIQ